MSSTQYFDFRTLVLRSARFARSHAPELFHHIAANWFLRSVYRRMTKPYPVSTAVNFSRAVNLPNVASDASAAVLKKEAARWNPGKRIDV